MDNIKKSENDIFKELIDASLLDEAPSDLSENVFDKLGISTSKSKEIYYKPVINKFTWLALGFSVTIICIVSLISSNSGTSVSLVSEFWDSQFTFINIQSSLLSELFNSTYMNLVAVTFISVFSVMFFENFIKSKRKRNSELHFF